MSTGILSVISLANLGLTIAVVLFLWANRKHILSGNGGNGDVTAVTTRQYERMVHRLDSFEQAEQRRAKDDLDFRRNVLDANDAQLIATKKQNSLLEKMLNGQQFLRGKVESLPCHNLTPDDCPRRKEGDE